MNLLVDAELPSGESTSKIGDRGVLSTPGVRLVPFDLAREVRERLESRCDLRLAP